MADDLGAALGPILNQIMCKSLENCQFPCRYAFLIKKVVWFHFYLSAFGCWHYFLWLLSWLWSHGLVGVVQSVCIQAWEVFALDICPWTWRSCASRWIWGKISTLVLDFGLVGNKVPIDAFFVYSWAIISRKVVCLSWETSCQSGFLLLILPIAFLGVACCDYLRAL